METRENVWSVLEETVILDSSFWMFSCSSSFYCLIMLLWIEGLILMDSIKVLILDSTLLACMLELVTLRVGSLVIMIGLLMTPELISQRVLLLTFYLCCKVFPTWAAGLAVKAFSLTYFCSFSTIFLPSFWATPSLFYPPCVFWIMLPFFSFYYKTKSTILLLRLLDPLIRLISLWMLSITLSVGYFPCDARKFLTLATSIFLYFNLEAYLASRLKQASC